MTNRIAYEKGLHQLGQHAYAYLQPTGSWGWSNAGLIVEGDASLLVDTLFDLKLTQEMLEAMRRVTKAAESIDIVVNTHANGDHCWGNQLVPGAAIVASRRCAEEMSELTPLAVSAFMAQAGAMSRELGDYLLRIFGPFDFRDVSLVPPTVMFDGELIVRVGNKTVRLIEVGPAHTRGDVLVHIPDDGIVFTGDILFAGSHPIMWSGPVGNWIRACDRVLAMDIETVVPGHGPVTDKSGVSETRRYFEYLASEARRRYEAGVSAAEAARDIALDRYASWGDAERVIVNVTALYREFAGDDSPLDVAHLFAQMAHIAAAPS